LGFRFKHRELPKLTFDKIDEKCAKILTFDEIDEERVKIAQTLRARVAGRGWGGRQLIQMHACGPRAPATHRMHLKQITRVRPQTKADVLKETAGEGGGSRAPPPLGQEVAGAGEEDEGDEGGGAEPGGGRG